MRGEVLICQVVRRFDDTHLKAIYSGQETFLVALLEEARVKNMQTPYKKGPQVRFIQCINGTENLGSITETVLEGNLATLVGFPLQNKPNLSLN